MTREEQINNNLQYPLEFETLGKFKRRNLAVLQLVEDWCDLNNYIRCF